MHILVHVLGVGGSPLVGGSAARALRVATNSPPRSLFGIVPGLYIVVHRIVFRCWSEVFRCWRTVTVELRRRRSVERRRRLAKPNGPLPDRLRRVGRVAGQPPPPAGGTQGRRPGACRRWSFYLGSCCFQGFFLPCWAVFQGWWCANGAPERWRRPVRATGRTMGSKSSCYSPTRVAPTGHQAREGIEGNRIGERRLRRRRQFRLREPRVVGSDGSWRSVKLDFNSRDT